MDGSGATVLDAGGSIRWEALKTGASSVRNASATKTWGTELGSDSGGGPYEVFFPATAPTDLDIAIPKRLHSYDSTTGAPKLLVRQADAAGTVYSGYSVGGIVKTSGALSTVSPSSGTAFTLAAASDTFLVCPVTMNPTAGAAATCKVELSPDNSTFSIVGIETVPLGVTFDGTIRLISLRVPAAWYVKLTVVNATLGTATYF